MNEIYMLNGNTNEMQQHFSQKEYRDDIIVRVDDLFYELYFYSPDRIEDEFVDGNFFSMPGLIMIKEIKTSKIIDAIKQLNELGYFKKLQGYKTFPLNNRFINTYYKNDLVYTDKLIHVVEFD